VAAKQGALPSLPPKTMIPTTDALRPRKQELAIQPKTERFIPYTTSPIRNPYTDHALKYPRWPNSSNQTPIPT